MQGWYVVGKESAEGDFYVYVFGPFMSETDARAYAIDFASGEEGFDSLEAELLTHEQAEELATDNVQWPYDSEGE